MNSAPAGDERRGVLYGLAAYGIWGIFPLYFHLLASASPIEVVVHRVLWSLLVCVVALSIVRGWRQLAPLRSARLLALLTIAAFVLALNWGVYIYAVTSGQVIQASLGYYINPLVTVLLGVLAFHERLRPLQWAAAAVGAVAVVVLTIAAGAVPWVALTLALSFATYGLIKKTVGGQLTALAGMTGETITLAPVALVILIGIEASGRGTFSQNPPWQALLLAASGIATVIPLLLFAAAARRVPLSTIGLMQYLTPTLQLLCGVLVFGEQMSAPRWAGFALVWTALVLLSVDSLRAGRRRANSRREQIHTPPTDPVDAIPA